MDYKSSHGAVLVCCQKGRDSGAKAVPVKQDLVPIVIERVSDEMVDLMYLLDHGEIIFLLVTLSVTKIIVGEHTNSQVEAHIKVSIKHDADIGTIPMRVDHDVIRFKWFNMQAGKMLYALSPQVKPGHLNSLRNVDAYRML